jgi:hypothetical protein
VDFSVPEYLIKSMERETTVGGIIVEDFTQWLGPEDILTKIDPFQLSRGDSRTFIYVHEAITGPNKEHCVAEPTVLLGTTRTEYTGNGASVEEALSDCLKRINGRAIDEFPACLIGRKDETIIGTNIFAAFLVYFHARKSPILKT